MLLPREGDAKVVLLLKGCRLPHEGGSARQWCCHTARDSVCAALCSLPPSVCTTGVQHVRSHRLCYAPPCLGSAFLVPWRLGASAALLLALAWPPWRLCALTPLLRSSLPWPGLLALARPPSLPWLGSFLALARPPCLGSAPSPGKSAPAWSRNLLGSITCWRACC